MYQNSKRLNCGEKKNFTPYEVDKMCKYEMDPSSIVEDAEPTIVGLL